MPRRSTRISPKLRFATFVVGLVIALLAPGFAQAGECPPPTFENVAYGPHERNVLDYWRAETDTPGPLILHIHGGGFWEGDKGKIRRRDGRDVRRCLDNGVSIASINYRFILQARLIDILHDTARALQFLRYHAEEWGFDKTRVASFGDSAGAGSSMWLGFHDDLADPDNPDPVLRESTRILAVGALFTQATYDFPQWPRILGVPQSIWTAASLVIAPSFYGRTPFELNTEEASALRSELDMLSMIDPGDPPIYLRSTKAKTDPQSWDHLLHHPRHAMAVKDKCEGAGSPCVLIDIDTPKDQDVHVLSFLFEQLGIEEKL